MPALQCDRAGCEHIMCDRYILDNTRRICDTCYAELLDNKESWPDVMSISDILSRISDFMRTRPGTMYTRRLDKEERDAVFERLTRRSKDDAPGAV